MNNGERGFKGDAVAGIQIKDAEKLFLRSSDNVKNENKGRQESLLMEGVTSTAKQAY